ncbi:hypothetical protein PVAP13_2KG516000 [Panicum virgatum]|uniref:F-box domain-containing protein n=1 Tax=Panicum virgatum TaxID=38727 RepID=A0A8T0WD21_PANVG|nr:hypothetical protein PVAP13_2KG516000 [Panicum virgatum]
MASDLARDERAMLNGGVLPTDVMHEILLRFLLRVPAKALCRLRLVCRAWRSLTSDPRFARAHSARHPVLVALLLADEEIHILDLSGGIVKRIRGLGHLIWYLTMHAGLVCVSTSALDAADAADADLVLNPATGAVSILPGNWPPLVHACVLGRVPSTGECKVLRLSYYLKNDDEGFVGACEVIALGGAGDQTWRAKPSPVNISADADYIAAVDGIAYFLSGAAGRRHVRPSHRGVEAGGSPGSAEQPYAYQETGCIQFAAWDGCFVVIHHKQRDCSTDLWFLVDVDKGSWTKRYSMRCASRWHHAPFYSPRPLGVLDDGRILAWLQKQYLLTAYDPRTETWADLASLSEHYHTVVMHQGSLLCPDLQG